VANTLDVCLTGLLFRVTGCIGFVKSSGKRHAYISLFLSSGSIENVKFRKMPNLLKLLVLLGCWCPLPSVWFLPELTSFSRQWQLS